MRVRLARVVLAAGGIALGLYGYHLLRHDLHSSVPNAAASVIVAWTFLAAGLVAWARRPESGVGLLMTFVAFLLLERKLQYSHDSAAFTFGFLFGELGFTAAFAHAVLAYPTGRLGSRFERAFIAGGYVVVLAFSLAQVLVWEPAKKCVWGAAYCAQTQPHNLLLVHRSDGVFQALRDSYLSGVYGVLAAVFILLVVRRIWRATPAGRRVLAPLMVGAVVVGVRGIWASLGFLPSSSLPEGAFYWWQVSGQIAVPLALLAGVLTAELAKGSVADLVVELAHTRPEGVRDALARALNDPSLQVAYWLPSSRAYVDGQGQPVALPEDGRAVTRLESVAAIVHDPGLDPGLVEAVGAAAGLTLHNARLQADVRAQLDQVQESRRRIVAAADERAQKIERDLHDGLQQRLVAVALELSIAQRQLGQSPGPEVKDVFADAVDQLKVAVGELREIARGVHPAVLTEEGLPGALESLAGRTPLPVKLATMLDDRLPREIEAAAYFVACEAVNNAVKHAKATALRITTERHNGTLVIEVADDGIGGARANGGSGLRGLIDRVEAHGGTLRIESLAGHGTRIIGELPCAS